MTLNLHLHLSVETEIINKTSSKLKYVNTVGSSLEASENLEMSSLYDVPIIHTKMLLLVKHAVIGRWQHGSIRLLIDSNAPVPYIPHATEVVVKWSPADRPLSLAHNLLQRS